MGIIKLVRIVIEDGEPIFYFRRDHTPKLVGKAMWVTYPDGSRCILERMNDGTMIAGVFSSKDHWNPLHADETNDTFDLVNDRCVEGKRIIVDDAETLMEEQTFSSIVSKFGVDEILDKMKKESLTVWEPES